METKTCSITENEIKALIYWYATNINVNVNIEDSLERMNYLNRRLKADKKEVKVETSSTPAVGEMKASW